MLFWRVIFLILRLVLLVDHGHASSDLETFHDPLEIWISTLRASETKTLVGINQHFAGKAYIRGFPKGILGTILFPIVVDSQDSATIGLNFTKGISATIYASGWDAQKSYLEYLKFVTEYFCITNTGEHWDCCDQSYLTASCEEVPQDARDVMELIVEPIQGISLMFLYHWCIKAWQDYRAQDFQHEKLGDQLERYCPSPCHGNPCLRLAGVTNPLFCQNIGAFEDEYRCDCNEMHVWDPQTLSCVEKNPCLNQQFPPCVVENTVRCVSLGPHQVKCICKESFMGYDCSLLRDACLERVNQSMPNGNSRCQVKMGNQCHPILGTDSYTCTCLTNHLSIALNEDNCLAHGDICKIKPSSTTSMVQHTEPKEQYALGTLKVSCLNGGECITSSDFTRAACLCPRSPSGEPLFRGQLCEFAIGVWSGWTEPSICLPQGCGHTRYRWRRRKCLNDTDPMHLVQAGQRPKHLYYSDKNYVPPVLPCVGASEEVLPCEPLAPCASARLPSRIREELFDYDSIYVFCYVTMAEIIFSLLSWYAFGEPLMNYLDRRTSQLIS